MRALLSLLLLAGCAHPEVPPLGQVPTESVTMHGDYKRIASCSYLRLDKIAGTGIKKVDLPETHSSRLALESGAVRYWELVFTEISPGNTRVEFSRAQTMWGPLGGSEIMPEVQACA